MPSSAAPRLSQPFAWHHVAAKVPGDWEISQYAVEDREGRIEWATRRGLEATVSWESCEREPDRETTVRAFLATRLAARGEAKKRKLSSDDVEIFEEGAFTFGRLSETLPIHAVAFDRTGKKLITWIFEGRSPDTGIKDVVRPILASTSFNDDPDTCEYRLFGVHCVLPREYKIEDMMTLPTSVMLAFEGDKSKARIVFRRWGLANLVLDGRTLESLYREAVRTNGHEVTEVRPARINGCEGFIAEFSMPRQHHSERYFMRRWKNGIAYVWHDKNSNRILSFEQAGPKGYPVLPPSSVPGLDVEESL